MLFCSDLYLQAVRDLTVYCLLETLHLSSTEMPQWSDFPKGGTIVQFKSWSGRDRKTKSMRELPCGPNDRVNW